MLTVGCKFLIRKVTMNILFLSGVLMWYVAEAADLHPATFCDDDSVFREITEGVSQSQRGFSTDQYEVACENHEGNLAISPAATYLGMSKIYFGAGELDRETLSSAVNITCNCLDSQFGLQDLSRSIQLLNGPEVRVTNQIFYQPDLKLTYSFGRIMESVFGNFPRGFNFNQPSSNFKLTEIILQNHPGLIISHGTSYIDQSDSLVLVDMSTFTQQWAMINRSCFDAPNIFYDKNLTEVNYVHKIGKFIYGHTTISGVKVTYVGIPSRGYGHQVNMFVVMPDEDNAGDDRLNEIIIDAEAIHKITALGTKKQVHVSLPLLDITFGADITSSLRQMMGDDLFTNAADLHKLTKTRKIHVDRVLHFSRIHLKERCGLELCPAKSMQQFLGNRPFIIVITTVGNNPIILLMGRYVGPSS